MTIEIYGSFKSRTRRVIWAAIEAGLEFDHHPLSPKAPELKAAPFLTVNPFGRIPAFRNEARTMSESLAINLHIAKTHAPALYPPAEEPTIWQWSFFAASDLDPWVTLFVGHSITLPKQERQPALAALGEQKLHIGLALLEQALSGRAFLVGDSFSIADLNVVAVILSLAFNDFAFDRWPMVASWIEACLARPAAQKALTFP